MKCLRCKKELVFEENILKAFSACPFCGAFIQKNLPPIENGTIEAELKKLVDDFGGYEVFSEENSSRFVKALNTISAPFDVARDKLLVANIKKIPQRMYSAIEMPQRERQQLVDACLDDMIAFDFSEKASVDVISWLAHVMQLPVKVEKTKVIEKVMGAVEYCYRKSSVDSESRTYKTCQIGKQIWFAENFTAAFINYSGPGTGILGSACDNSKCGRFYPYNEYLQYHGNAISDGWRIPRLEDWEDLNAYIKSLGFDTATALKSINQWHGSADDGLDLFGFYLLPSTRDDDGTSAARFWSSTKKSSGEMYCVAFTSNRNDMNFDCGGTSNYIRCVRFVKDV